MSVVMRVAGMIMVVMTVMVVAAQI
jgi:hypothetical protein